MPAGGGTPAFVLLAATLGFLGGRRWPTPASDVEDRESGAFRRGGSADVALPLGRQLEEAGSAGQCKLERSCAYSIDEEAMVSQVQLVKLPLVPEAYRERIIIELGANTVYTVRDTLLKQPRFKNPFVVSFEPLLDKYASNLAARSKAVMRAALGHHHRRGVILPFAVGPTEGVMDLQVSDIDGCSSLLNFSASGKRGGKAKGRPGCSVARERRRVPGVTLRTVLRWLPAGSEVDFLKSDIQGMDLHALRSAGDQVGRLRRVQMEAALGHHYNSDSPSCAEVLVAMGGLGFRLATAAEVDGFAPLEGAFGTPLVYQGSETTCASTHRQEVDLFFVRKANTPTGLA